MLNLSVLQGRLVADPEIRQTPGGVSVATFRLAVDRNYQQNGQRQADFINCVAWRGTAEFIGKYFGKGDMCLVEGSLQSRNYEDKNGAKRTAYEVIVDHVYFSGGRKDAAADGQRTGEPYATAGNRQDAGAASKAGEIISRAQSFGVPVGSYDQVEMDVQMLDDDLPY